jgi:hypothetical protein
MFNVSMFKWFNVEGFNVEGFNVQWFTGSLFKSIRGFGSWILEFGIWNLDLCRPVALRLVAPHKIRTCDLGLGTYMPTVAGYPGIYIAQSPRRPSPCHPS